MNPDPNCQRNALILLVEDSQDDALLTLRALEKNTVDVEDVVVAQDGLEALDYLFAKGVYADRDADLLPRLILLDINLPRMSGIEVLRRLRAEDRTRFLPVVMLTSSAQDRDLIESYSFGANSYVQKPVNTAEFDTVVQQMAAYWLGLNETPYREILQLELTALGGRHSSQSC